MEQNGQQPGAGPIVVTGATGGVGSLAINMLAARGYEVVAVSGKRSRTITSRRSAQARILRRQEINLGSRPLEKRSGPARRQSRRRVLTWLTRTTDFWGNIASIGLAGSHKLETRSCRSSCAA